MSWKKRALGELCTLQKGKIGIKKATPGKYPLVVTAEERLSHNEYHFEGNAVIIPLVSSSGHGHKSLKRIHFQSGKFAVGNILCTLIPKDENILRADYLYRFLDLNKEKELVSRMKGMANVTLPMKEIAKIKIPLPPIEAQIEFVQQYANLEEKSNDLEEEVVHQLDLVKQLRQAFLREAMQGKLVPQDPNDEPASVLLEKIKAEKDKWIKQKVIKKPKPIPPILDYEIPYDIPTNWIWCRLGEFAYVTSGSTPKSTAFVSEGIPFLKMYNLREQKIDFDYKQQFITEEVHNGSLKRCRAFPGDLIMNIVGPPLGKLAIIPDNLPECNFNQAAVLIRSTILEINKYLFWYLSEMSEINEVETKGVAGQNNLSVTQAHNLKIPLPPLPEQKRIVAKLDKLMHYCDDLETSIKESQHQNALLLQQVLREALEPTKKELVE
ncbi:restriction endonuclease subunit S [Flagellimonas sp.]|uniref:restriction endonuclease subunit S n=1 Tax=Flagellimonas sp. TaxID=2058762 RepID=UPI003AB72BE6